MLSALAKRLELDGHARVQALLDAAYAQAPLGPAAVDALARLGAIDALERCVGRYDLPEEVRTRALLQYVQQASGPRLMAQVHAQLGALDEGKLLELLGGEASDLEKLLAICGLGIRSAGKAIGPLRRLLRKEAGVLQAPATRALRMIQARVGASLGNCELSFAQADGKLSLRDSGQLSPS